MKITIRTVSSVGDLVKRLRRKGWTRGGSGTFGYVMLKGDLCWKITNGKDRGYRRFIAQVAAGRFSGPHAPRLKLILKDREGRVAVLMERLMLTLRKHYGDWEAEAMISSVLHRKSIYDDWITLRAKAGEYNLPLSFFQFGKRLAAYANRLGEYMDVHGDNIMLRRDGTLVVTDPF